MAVVLMALAIVLAYLIGSFPSAYIVARLKKDLDIRQVGSRNMGAMNVFYSVGFWWGMLVLALDIGKGIAAVALARLLGTPDLVQMGAGLAAVVGHNFPLFLHFKGGRGGAMCIGILIFIMPWGAPFYLGFFLLFLAVSKFPTMSYSLAFLCFPFIAWLIYHRPDYIIFTIVLVLLPLIRYIPRIKEMRARGGSWGHVVQRKKLGDRL